MSGWIFQGNPKRYPVLDHLLDGEREINWSVARHLDDIQVGDNAALWVSGDRAGIYAIGQVTGELYEDVADSDWIDPKDRGKVFMFCPLRWDDVRIEHPILKTDLLGAGGFEQARIIRQPMAGNPFKVTEDEWRMIQRLR